jgi:hypothetical protein
MHKYSCVKQKRIFIGIIGLLLLVKLLDLAFPISAAGPRQASYPWVELLLIAALGWLGIILAERINIPKMWNRKFLKCPISFFYAGIGIGAAFMLYDSIAHIGDISVGLPASLLFYIWGAVSTEVIMHLFPVAFLTWLFGFFIRQKDILFWVFASIVSVVSAASMLAAFGNPAIPLVKPGIALLGLLGIMVFAAEMVSFRLLKGYGLLASIIYRLSFYLVWHIIWPFVYY